MSTCPAVLSRAKIIARKKWPAAKKICPLNKSYKLKADSATSLITCFNRLFRAVILLKI